ncbi:MAG: ATP-binding protein [Bacteroidetes bacterium]|nr:ATP-binding protein [Bacteroidota bacterium]
MVYIKRMIEPVLHSYLETFSVVAITGPRQSGKSTMLRSIFDKTYRYVTFDDYRIVSFFQTDPEAFMMQYSDKVIFDEVQKVPLLFNYLKIVVDNDRSNKGKFILTGSSQFTMNQQITESLAGRIGLLVLLPFQMQEVPVNLRDDSIFKGSFPEIVMSSYKNYQAWYSSYLETFVMKDVKSLTNIGDLHDFRQFIKLLASQASRLLNMSTISRILGISVSTVKRWISVLEAAYIIFLLPPFHENSGKRIVKNHKVYFYDTGLLCFLTGISTRDLYENGPMSGSVFENYLVAEIIKKHFHSGNNSMFYFYRTSNQVEVDLIIESGGCREWVEIKKSSTFKPLMTRPLESLVRPGDKAALLYNGVEFPYKENVRVINYRQFLVD